VLALKAIFGKQIAGEMILAWGKYQQALSRQALNDVKKRQRKGSRKNKISSFCMHIYYIDNYERFKKI